MKKRIFRSVFISMVLVLAASLALITVVLNRHFISLEEERMKTQADLAAAGIETEGMGYLSALDLSDYRVTWIARDGTVLYDSQSDASQMENHADRAEFQGAVANGSAYATRSSHTLMTATIYYAQLLSDGTVVRIAIARSSLLATFLQLISAFLWILIAAACVSALVAVYMSRKLVKPINEIDLDHPLDMQEYPEMRPLLVRIDDQNKEIAAQLETVHRQEKEFLTVSQAIQEGLVLADANGKILSINLAAKMLLAPDGRNTENISDLAYPDLIGKLFAKAKSFSHAENSVTTPDGRIFNISFDPVTSHKQLTGVSILSYDATETYQAQQMRQEFTANVSHELKTPLQSIMGSAELLENGMVKKQDVPVFLKRIHKEAARMLQLIDDIIRLSQLDELEDAREEKMDLAQSANEVLEALSSSFAEHGIHLEKHIETATIKGSPQLVYEIAYNLIDNAIRYNKPDGSVTVSVYPHHAFAMLQVADTGIGIPEASQERIFERFYRVDKSRSRKTGGTGLGLSIVKHAAALCGGTIRLESKEGVGSTFTVNFPLLEDAKQ